MNKRIAWSRVLLLAVTMGFLVTGGSLILAQEHHWTYEGAEGPEHWGDIESPLYPTCADGTAQSPINVTNATGIDLKNIEFHYGETALSIFNNGHTIQVNVDEGSSITYSEVAYDLVQFHFHHPSEHTINGESAAMEIHFVHRNAESGNLAVVGVMLTASDMDNPAYQPIFDYLPAEESEPETVGMPIDLNSLLPEARTFYTYNGSLTTPPCSEIVRWLLLDNPVELGEMQVESFGSVFEMNARPVQPLNDRDLFVDTSM